MPDAVTINTSNMRGAASRQGRDLVVRLSGVADMSGKAALDEFLRGVHVEARALSGGRVTFDITDVEFMNSSCMKAVVTWMSLVLELPATLRYKIVLRTDPNRLWQRRSARALSGLAPGVVETIDA